MSPDGPADALMGIGGAPEGVITAGAVKCLGGDMQGRLWAKHEQDRAQADAEGQDLKRVLALNDLCAGENVFVSLTGITDGEILPGVRYDNSRAQTYSLAMRSVSGTVRPSRRPATFNSYARSPARVMRMRSALTSKG